MAQDKLRAEESWILHLHFVLVRNDKAVIVSGVLSYDDRPLRLSGVSSAMNALGPGWTAFCPISILSSRPALHLDVTNYWVNAKSFSVIGDGEYGEPA